MAACTICALFALLYLIIWLRTRHFIRTIDEVEVVEYTLVLGAGLEKNGEPSDILKDRIEKSVELFKSGKTQYLVMSGSSLRGKDEPGAMQFMAHFLGVPQSALLIDRKGISTFHSCANLKSQYNPEKVIIISQRYHLTRSLFFQRLLGVEAVGVPADIYHFSFYKKAYWLFREFIALPYNLGKLILFLFKVRTHL